MSTLTLRIEDDMAIDLEHIAQQQHRSKSDVAREMLRKNIALMKFQALREKALPHAESAGYLTDEDVFRNIS